MSWDNEKTLNFINEYEKRPILWKKTDRCYYNTTKKEDAWRELSDIFNENTELLKKKIDSLRGSRRRERSRMLQSKGTGKGRKDIYVSKWFAWDAMKFLEDPEEIRSTTSSYSHSEEENEKEATERENDEDMNENESEDRQKNIDDEAAKETEEVRKESPVTKKFVSPKKWAPKRKRPNEDPRIGQAFKILQDTAKIERKSDECSAFGEYISEKLRKFDQRNRVILQHKINNLLFQAELNDLQSQCPVSSVDLGQNYYHYSTSPSLSQSSSVASPLESPRDNNEVSETFGVLHDYFSNYDKL